MKLMKAGFDLSKILVLISAIIWLWLVHKESAWEKNSVIQNDVIGYYSYLPATFIYKDLTFKFKKNLPKDFPGKIWGKKLPSKDGYVQKMTMGVSILYSPFFFIAHQHAKLMGYDANGYTEPYSRWLVYSAIFYALMAMILIRSLLLKYFDQITTSLTLIILFFGTNLYYYSIYRGAVSHVYSMFLISAFIWITIKWHEKPKLTTSILLGLTGGLITLIRPTNAIVFIFPILYQVYNKQSLNDKLSLMIKNWGKLLVVLIMSFLVVSILLIYWKVITDQWLYFSYGDEGFFFLNPHVINGLFSFRKGWLIYTPLMALAIIGIPILFKKLKDFALPISIFFFLNIWVIFSWWTWWYGASFSSRPMIDSYPILAIPLALIVSYLLKKKWMAIISIGIIVFFVRLNIFQTNQYRSTLLHYDSMTKEAYWAIWNRNHFPEDYSKLIQEPDYNSALKGEKEKLKNN